MRGDLEVPIQSLNHCKEKEGKIRIHFWHPNVSSLNLSTSCFAMLPHVPNLFSASDGAARRSLSHSAQVLGGVRDRRRRRCDRFDSSGVFYLAGSPDVGPTGPARCCLLDPRAPLAVSRSLLQPPPSPLLVKILQGYSQYFMQCLYYF